MESDALPAWLEHPPKPSPAAGEVIRMRDAVRNGLDTSPERLAPQEGEPLRPSRHRLAALAGAGVAAATVIGVVVLPQGGAGVAEAATPEVLSYQVEDGRRADLSAYIDQVAQLPAAARYLDADHRVVTDSWSLFSRIDGKQVDSAVIPEHRDFTWRSDGSGTLDVVTGEPMFPNAEYRQAWEEEGNPGKEGMTITSEQFAAGEYDPSFPAVLPTDSGELLTLLEAGHPIDKIGTAELFVAVADLYREQTPAPRARAQILELLDQREDLADLGNVNDRLGRGGRAVAVSSDYSGLETRYVLTFDAANGALLSYEQVLTGDVGKLDVPSPAVTSYELFQPDESH